MALRRLWRNVWVGLGLFGDKTLSRWSQLAIVFIFLVAPATSFEARSEMIKGYPDAIVCAAGPNAFVLYIDRTKRDTGDVYYSALGGGAGAARIDKDGIFRRQNAPDCDGKSIEQLKSEGKTFNFAR